MDADRGDPRLHRLFVEGIDELLVVEPPRVFRGLRLQRVADRIALPAVGLDLGDAAVDLFHPAGLGRGEQRMKEQPLGAGDAVDGLVRELDLIVRQEPRCRVVERSAAQQGHLRVAVEVDLLQEVLKLVAIERYPELILQQRRVPMLPGIFDETENVLDLVVVPHEMNLIVEDKLSGKPIRPLGGGFRLGRFGG